MAVFTGLGVSKSQVESEPKLGEYQKRANEQIVSQFVYSSKAKSIRETITCESPKKIQKQNLEHIVHGEYWYR